MVQIEHVFLLSNLVKPRACQLSFENGHHFQAWMLSKTHKDWGDVVKWPLEIVMMEPSFWPSHHLGYNVLPVASLQKSQGEYF